MKHSQALNGDLSVERTREALLRKQILKRCQGCVCFLRQYARAEEQCTANSHLHRVYCSTGLFCPRLSSSCQFCASDKYTSNVLPSEVYALPVAVVALVIGPVGVM